MVKYIFFFFIFSFGFAQDDISGCTDSYAANYNPDASIDDGSCSGYLDNGDYSLSFGGDGDYTHLDWSENMSSYTISIWVKSNVESQGTFDAFFNTYNNPNNGLQLDCNGSNNYRFHTEEGSIVIAPLSTEWSHIAVVADNSTTTIYFNGELINSSNWVETDWNQIELGRNRNVNNPGNYTVDNVRIWNIALSQSEVQQEMVSDEAVSQDGLFVDWRLNSGEGDILYDHSGNANHATNFNGTWDSNVPSFPEISVSPEQITETLYIGESVSETITIYNNGDSDLDWEIGFSSLRNNNQGFVLPEDYRNESYTMDPLPTSTGENNHSENSAFMSRAQNASRDGDFNIFVYSTSSVSSVINEHPDLNSSSGFNYDASTLEDLDVLFNIRNGDNLPEETLEWIYNGGTWVGEWSSNDIPINTWGIVGGTANGGGCCTQSITILDEGHWLAQNIDWDNIPVGSEPTQFQRNISLDDPDAHLIVSSYHGSYGEIPLLVEKQYGDGTIILFNWDYQDNPAYNEYVEDMIRQVAYYAAAIAGGVNWLFFSEQNGVIPPGSSQDVELLLDATSLDEGSYDTEFFVLSNDPLQPAVGVPVQLLVETPTPDISVTPDSFDEILFVDEVLNRDIIIQNAGAADLNWNLNLFNYGRDGSSYTFTNCDKEGKEGPSQEDCDSEYQGTMLEGFVTVNGGIQQWIVPASGTYTIDVYGAQGGDGSYGGSYTGGLGANMQGQFALEAGQILHILVGQKGISSTEGGGGGGSFVVKEDDTPLIVAGGGGGAGGYGDGVSGVTETSGTDGAAGGTGGMDGNGGSVGSGNAGAGAGFNTNGGGTNPSYAYLNGGVGGLSPWGSDGGFGGGGIGWGNGGNGGGAGGYSGGGTSGASYIGGGGGGSFNSGLDQDNIAGANADHGMVTITLDGPSLSWATLSDNAGVTGVGEADTVTLTLDASDLEMGEYSAGISLISNDPDDPDIDIPISMTVIYDVEIADIDDASIEEDSSLELTLLNDYDSYNYEYMVTTDTSAVAVSVFEDTLTLIPITDWTGTSNISVVLTLENSLSDTTDFNLTVTPVNDAPIAYDALFFVEEDDTLNALLIANDGDSLEGQFDNQALEFSILEGFENGSFALGEISGELTYIPAPDYFGNDTMSYRVVDDGITGEVLSPFADTAMIVVQVLPVNDTPVLLSIQDTSLYEDSSLSLPISVSDIDNDEVSLSVSTTNPDKIFTEISESTLFINPSPDWHDTVTVTVVANDNMDRAIDVEEFELVILPVNDSPNAYGDIFYIDEDEALQSVLLADDGDTLNHLYDIQSLSFSVLEEFYHGSFELNQETGDYVYAPAPNYFGSDSMLYMVTDDGVTGELISPLTDTALIVVHTLPVNDAPVLSEISDTVMYEDSLLIIPISVIDVDNDEIELDSYTSNEDYIAVIIEDGNIHINSYFNWNGTVTVTVVANDNMGRAIDAEEFELSVLPVNDIPEFTGEMNALVGVGIEFEFLLQGFDIDADPLTFSLDDSYAYPEWIGILSDPFRLVGAASDDGTYSIPIVLTDGFVSVVDSFQLNAQYFQPRISSITDVPDDQGGRVYVEFQGSFFDSPEETNQFYTLSRLDSIGGEWVWIGVSTVSATGIESYVVEVSTLVDSTTFGTGLTEFKVVAFTNYGVYQSDATLGYSLDNLAPMAPESFSAFILDQSIVLFWDQNSAEDFSHFQLEKSYSENFDHFEIFTLDDTSFIDTNYVMNTTYFYRLTAEDVSGNKSEYTNAIEMTVLEIDGNIAPEEFALHQNYPNPFNPVTTIRYDIPIESRVLIQVFDIQGRFVKTLMNDMESAGKKSILWNATNQIGEPVSAGMYLYLIQTDAFKEVRKMLLLK